jgi:hypothetical protein
MSKPAAPSADPAGRQHPHPEALLEFARKMARQIGRHYVARTANMIKADFPGSAETLVPKLRAIYKEFRD